MRRRVRWPRRPGRALGFLEFGRGVMLARRWTSRSTWSLSGERPRGEGRRFRSTRRARICRSWLWWRSSPLVTHGDVWLSFLPLFAYRQRACRRARPARRGVGLSGPLSWSDSAAYRVRPAGLLALVYWPGPPPAGCGAGVHRRYVR